MYLPGVEHRGMLASEHFHQEGLFSRQLVLFLIVLCRLSGDGSPGDWGVLRMWGCGDLRIEVSSSGFMFQA